MFFTCIQTIVTKCPIMLHRAVNRSRQVADLSRLEYDEPKEWWLMHLIRSMLFAVLFASGSLAVAQRPADPVAPVGKVQSSTPATATATATSAAPPVTASATASAGASPGSTTVSDSTQDDYRLGVADKIRIIVFNEETLSGEFSVSDSGTLSLPLIGDVQARGRSPREVVKDITAKLADGYLREPRVSLDVLTYRPFYIMGEVTKPGEYPYTNGLTVMNSVARAEGFTYRANKGKVFIKRAGETEERRYPLQADLRVYPGDTVRIGERFF